MASYVIQSETLEAIGDAIRDKTDSGDLIAPKDMASKIMLIDTAKEEQEEILNITENGTTEVTPDEGKALSKVTVNVEVSGEDDFIGIKYSDFDIINAYYLPQTADARSLDKCMLDENSKRTTCYNLFANNVATSNNNRSAGLKTIYMPSQATLLNSTFTNCVSLTTIIGDFSAVINISGAFEGCRSLTELPYFPNLQILQNRAIQDCKGLTNITFYKILTSWHTGALSGCTNITTINIVDGWNTAIYAQHCTNLSQECLHDMVEKLADMTGKTPLTFYIGASNIEKIDEEHITMLDNKNINYY